LQALSTPRAGKAETRLGNPLDCLPSTLAEHNANKHIETGAAALPQNAEEELTKAVIEIEIEAPKGCPSGGVDDAEGRRRFTTYISSRDAGGLFRCERLNCTDLPRGRARAGECEHLPWVSLAKLQLCDALHLFLDQWEPLPEARHAEWGKAPSVASVRHVNRSRTTPPFGGVTRDVALIHKAVITPRDARALGSHKLQEVSNHTHIRPKSQI
jgi:hypothetical protein